MEGRQFFIGGLLPETTDDELRSYFEAFGEVLEAKVMRLKGTSQSRGFGFVTLLELEDRPLPLDDHVISGKTVEVKLAVPVNEMHTLVKTRRCFVGGLPRDIEIEELATHFKQFGRVIAIELPHEKGGGKFLNCAFVTFEKDEAADAAVQWGVHEFHGKPADVKKADPKPSVQSQPTASKASPADDDFNDWDAMGQMGSSSFPSVGFGFGGGASHSMRANQGIPNVMAEGLRTRRSQDVTGMYFVGGLNRATTNEDLKSYFSSFGEVRQARVVMHEGKSRGFGFVTFLNAEQAVAAGLMTHAHSLQGHHLDVKSAVPEEELATVLRTKRIFVGALPPTATQEVMWEHFQQFGRVIDCEIVYNKVTQRPKGCGFVIFESEDHAENAVRFPSHIILGQRVDVKKAEPRSRQPGNPQYQVTQGLQPPGVQPRKGRKLDADPGFGPLPDFDGFSYADKFPYTVPYNDGFL